MKRENWAVYSVTENSACVCCSLVRAFFPIADGPAAASTLYDTMDQQTPLYIPPTRIEKRKKKPNVFSSFLYFCF